MTALEYKTLNYKEALRYIDNASDILRTKANKNGKFYEDNKYVRMACGTAYNAVLIALDVYLKLKDSAIEKKKHQRKSVDDYREALAKLDKKLLNEYNTAYDILHLYAYYDGLTKYDIIRSGFDSAAEIINKIKPTGLAGLKIES